MDDLYRCKDCNALHTYEAICLRGKCRRCRSKYFVDARHVEEVEIPLLERMGYDWKAAGWSEVDDPDSSLQTAVQKS